MQKNTTTTLLASFGLALAAAPAMGEFALFQDDFGVLGSGVLATDPLDGTTPEVTQGTTAWVADAEYAADGSVTAASDDRSRFAYLALGSLINDNRGNPNAIYTLSATVDVTTNPSPGSGTGNATREWEAIGFYNDIPASNFSSSTDLKGIAWMLRRADGEIAAFLGPGTGGGLSEVASSPNNVPGQIDLQIVLDLSDYDGTSNYGSVTYNAKLSSDAVYTEIAADELGASSSTFAAVGVGGGDVVADFSSFQLTQVPEPSSLALLGLGGVCMLKRRRRAS